MRDNTLINYAHHRGGARQRRAALSVHLQRLRLSRLSLQTSAAVEPLKEEDAYPADAEDGYGWEKLYMERVCRHYREDFGLETRIVRFHNIFGPLGTYDGGREKSPAAICRKVARGTLTASDRGLGRRRTNPLLLLHRRLRRGHLPSDAQPTIAEPLNLGQDRLISINQLVDMVAHIAGKRIRKRYDPTKPQGVRGRNSDNTRLRAVLGWEPAVSLEDGLAATYRWIAAHLGALHA